MSSADPKTAATTEIFKALFTVGSMIYQANQAKKQKRALEEEQRRMRDRMASRDVRLSGSNVPGRFIYGFARVGGDTILTHVIDGFPERLTVDSDIELLGSMLESSVDTKKNEILILQRVLGFSPLNKVVDADINDQPLIILDDNGFIDRTKAQPYYDFFRSEIDLLGNRLATQTREDIKTDFLGQNFDSETSIFKTNEILPETSVFKDWSYATELLKMNQDDPQFPSRPDIAYYIEGRKIKTINYNPTEDVYSISNNIEFSNNAVRCLLDYCLSEWGPKFTASDLDLPNWYSNINKAEMIAQENAIVSGRVHTAVASINASEEVDTDFSLELTLSGNPPDNDGENGTGGNQWHAKFYKLDEYLPPNVVKLQGTYSITLLEKGNSQSSVMPAHVLGKTRYTPLTQISSSITDISSARTLLRVNGESTKFRINGTATKRVSTNTYDRVTGTIQHVGPEIRLTNLQIAKYDFINDTESTTFTTPTISNTVYLPKYTRIYTNFGYISLVRDLKIDNINITLKNRSVKYFIASVPYVSGYNEQNSSYGIVSFNEIQVSAAEPYKATRNIKKHEFNGSIDSGNDHIANINEILNTIPGAIMFRDVTGKIKINIPNEQISTEGHSVDTVTDSDIIGEVTVSTPDNNERLNEITINYANASKDFASDTYTYIDRDSYINKDNSIVLSSSLNLIGVSNKYNAEYIARTTVNESRRDNYSWKESHRGIFKEPGDVVLLTPANRGIRTQEDSEGTGVFVRITSQKLNPDLTISFEGYHFDIADYTYNKQTAEARELHKDFDFSVRSPTNLSVTLDTESTVNIPPVTFNWTDSVDSTVIEYQIENTESYQGDTDTDSEYVSSWSPISVVPQGVETIKFLPVTTNTSTLTTYAIRIRAKTTTNRFSEWVYITNIGNPKINEFSDGANTAVVYAYNRSSTTLTTGPSATRTWTFSSGTFDNNDLGDGWTGAIPSGTDNLYVCNAVASSQGTTDVVTDTDWSNPELFSSNGTDGEDGVDGVDGNAYLTIVLYQNSQTSPTVPAVSSGYNTSGDPVATGSWTVSPSSPGANEFTWRTNLTLQRVNNVGNWSSYSTAWSTPERLTGTAGTNGVSGFSARVDIAYFDDVSGTNPSYPSGTLSGSNYTAATRGTRNFQGTNTVNWTQGETETAVSTTVSDYEITQITGDNGINGLSNRLDLAYANSSDGSTGFDTDYFTDALYIGTDVVSYTAGSTPPTQSTTNTDYEWSRLRGVDGDPGASGDDAPRNANGFIYDFRSTAGSAPTGGSINWSTGVLTPPSGWSNNDPGTPTTGEALYVSYWSAVETTYGGTTTITYTTPVLAVTNVNDVRAINYDGPLTPTDTDHGTEGYFLDASEGNAVFNNIFLRENIITTDAIEAGIIQDTASGEVVVANSNGTVTNATITISSGFTELIIWQSGRACIQKDDGIMNTNAGLITAPVGITTADYRKSYIVDDRISDAFIITSPPAGTYNFGYINSGGIRTTALDPGELSTIIMLIK